MKNAALLARHRDALVRRTGQVVLPSPAAHSTELTSRRERLTRAALAAELAAYGYVADGALTRAFMARAPQQQKQAMAWLTDVLARAKGADKPHIPLFAGFPKDVPDDETYFLKRVVAWTTQQLPAAAREWVLTHLAATMVPGMGATVRVLSCGCEIHPALFDAGQFSACPICQQQVDELSVPADESHRAALVDTTPLRPLTLAGENAMDELVLAWTRAPVAMTAEDAQTLKDVLQKAPMGLVKRLYEAGIPNRETRARVGAALLWRDAEKFRQAVAQACDTATDALRLASVLSTDDAALVLPSHFRLSRPLRRAVVTALERVCETDTGLAQAGEDACRRPRRFVALFHHLHAGSWEVANERLRGLVDTVRNAIRTIPTFARRVEHGLDALRARPTDGSVLGALLDALGERPGEFARRLDAVMRVADDRGAVLDAFETAAGRVATPVLLSLLAHARSRSDAPTGKNDVRLFIPKGPKASLHGVADTRAPVERTHLARLGRVVRTALEQRFAAGAPLGRVWVDPALKSVPVPAGLGTATTGLDTLSRGTRQALPEDTRLVRLFVYWKENADSGRVDVDLSLTMYKANWESAGHVAFTNLAESGFQHSGDVQSAPNGATEYIDVDLKKALKSGVRYVVTTVISYTGQPFDAFEAQVGVMPRQNDTGRVFEPKTVAARGDLTAPTTQQTGLALDLKTREWVWLDLAAAKSRMRGAVIHQQEALGLLCRNAFQWADERPSMYDLLTCHARARGTLVAQVEDADRILGMELARVTPQVVSEWLTDPAPAAIPRAKAKAR